MDPMLQYEVYLSVQHDCVKPDPDGDGPRSFPAHHRVLVPLALSLHATRASFCSERMCFGPGAPGNDCGQLV